MRIITWNVFVFNTKIKKLIDQALSYEPDILCFQELPDPYLPYLQAQKGYTVTHALDFTSPRPRYTGHIVILTKHPPVAQRIVEYSRVKGASLWERVFYRAIMRSTEKRLAPIVNISYGSHDIQITSARFSCAVGSKERLHEFSSLIKHLDRHKPAILCGDFNIIDDAVFKFITGWVRGFHLNEYFINERKAFEDIVKEYGYRNIFRNISTYITSIPRLQYDHILIPESWHVNYHTVEKKTVGSDHRMLLADIELPR